MASDLGTGGAGGGAVVVWSWYFSLPEYDGRMRVTVLDVGQGDAVLIQTPSGVNVLVDGGLSGGVLARALARQLPLFTPRIDLLVIAALLVADHGPDDTTQADWVAAINPQVALISVGAGNPDGDPSPDVLQRLAGRTVLRTDELWAQARN